MRSILIKRCEACGETRGLTKHHVYPKSLSEVWGHKVKQVMALLCRTCHDVVHYRGGRRVARLQGKHEYVRRFCDPQMQAVIGSYRLIIRQLERESRALHIGELLN
jgi:hypothetical protein